MTIGPTTQGFTDFNKRLLDHSLEIHQSLPVGTDNHHQVFNESVFFSTSVIIPPCEVGIDRSIFQDEETGHLKPTEGLIVKDQDTGENSVLAMSQKNSFKVHEDMASTQLADHPANQDQVDGDRDPAEDHEASKTPPRIPPIHLQ